MSKSNDKTNFTTAKMASCDGCTIKVTTMLKTQLTFMDLPFFLHHSQSTNSAFVNFLWKNLHPYHLKVGNFLCSIELFLHLKSLVFGASCQWFSQPVYFLENDRKSYHSSLWILGRKPTVLGSKILVIWCASDGKLSHLILRKWPLLFLVMIEWPQEDGGLRDLTNNLTSLLKIFLVCQLWA